jgi:hypothetical protein
LTEESASLLLRLDQVHCQSRTKSTFPGLIKMADFSEYTGPSDEWIALERTLPAPGHRLSAEQLKAVTNKDREDLAAREMAEQGKPRFFE